MKNPVFICNAFSLKMVSEFPCKLKIQELKNVKIEKRAVVILDNCDNGVIENITFLSAVIEGAERPILTDVILESAVGHQDTANVLGVPMNRANVKLEKGDSVIVAQLQGGRLPEGSTTLPEGFSFKFLLVTVL